MSVKAKENLCCFSSHHRFPSWGHTDWDQLLTSGSSWWRLWHQCSYYLLHVQWTARVPQGQSPDWLGVCQSAHFSGTFIEQKKTVCEWSSLWSISNIHRSSSYVWLLADLVVDVFQSGWSHSQQLSSLTVDGFRVFAGSMCIGIIHQNPAKNTLKFEIMQFHI